MSKRSFIIGEEWLFYKLYCGVKTSNQLLLELIDPLISELLNNQLIDKWFFVRYFDPDPHLRVRLHVYNTNKLNDIIEICTRKFLNFLNARIIWRVEVGTYFRELERYGSNSIEYAEEIFHLDSDLVIRLLHYKDVQNIYLLSILKSVDSFLDLFEFTSEEKRSFYTTGSIFFNNEFGLSNEHLANIKTKLALKIQQTTVQDKAHLENVHELILSFISRRNLLAQKSIEHIKTLDLNQKLEIPISKLIHNYIHMFFNRAFECQQRYAELIGYNLMCLKII